MPDKPCTACNLHKRSKCNRMPGTGPVDAELMVIGEAPGATEEARGRPFVGGSGQYLRSILEAAGVSSKGTFYTNAVRCRPESNKKPTPVQMAKCWPYLEAEIARVNPKRIIFAGAQAMWTCLRITGILKLANEQMVWNGRPVMPVLHPAYLLRVLNDRRNPSRYETSATIETIKKFMAVLLDSAVKPPKVKIELCGDEVLPLSLALNGMAGPMVIDFETTGLDWTVDKIKCLGLHDGTRTLVVPDRWLNRDTVKIIYDRVSTGMLAGQNLKFDLHFLLNLFEEYMPAAECRKFLESLWWRASNRQIYDTMVATHWMDSSLPKGLKTQAYLRTNHGGYDREIKDDKGKFKEGVEDELLYNYCGTDCIVTHELYRKDSEQLPVWYWETIMPLLVGTFLMERRGVPIDTGHLERIGKECVRLAAVAKKKAVKLTGEKDFNPNSAKQVGKALQAVGWRPSSWTPKTNEPRVQEEDIENFKHPLSEAILTYRKKTKLKSTFVDNVLERTRSGVLHPTFNITGTVTGRLSSDSPNFQNMPKGKGVRQAVYPGPGWRVIDGDLSQAELRVLAFYSKDPVMIKAYKDGDDLHAITARAIYKKDKVTKAEREIGKRTNFAVVYQESPQGFAKRLGVTVEEAEKHIAGFFRRYKGAKQFFNKVYRDVGRTGWISNLFGFRRRFKWWGTGNRSERRRYEREAANMPIQGTASEFTSRAFVDYLRGLIQRYGFDNFYTKMPFPVAIVHDSIVETCPVIMLDEAERLQEHMVAVGRYFDNLLPMKAEVKISSRWGEEKEEGSDAKKEKGQRKGAKPVRLCKIRRAAGKCAGAAKKAARVGRSRA